MLAGYLPFAGCLGFAKDRTNPRSKNARPRLDYICNVPLTYRECFSTHAQDLVKRMLVVQPPERADLREVAQHSWLSDSDYAHVVSDISENPPGRPDFAEELLTFGVMKLLGRERRYAVT